MAKSDSPFTSLKRFKPGVKRKGHVLFTALLWSMVGIGLLVKGTSYLWDEQFIYIFLLVGFLVGTAKARFILDKAARKNLERIERLEDGACLGAAYSLRTWRLLLCMIALGIIIRHSPLPHYFIGTFYVAIGWGLCLASRKGWLSWFQYD